MAYTFKKQYLTGLKNLLEKKKKDALQHHDSYEEKTKKATEGILKNSSPEQAKKIREQQEQNFNANQKGRENSEKFFNEKLKPIDDYLANNSAEALSEPPSLIRGPASRVLTARLVTKKKAE